LTRGADPVFQIPKRGLGVIEEPEPRVDDAPSDVDAEEAMHIHRPKPLHGAREILTEIAVIVVGIAIALGGEQVLQGFEWSEKVTHAEAQMRFEVADDDGPQVYERLALSPCIGRALAGVRQTVESGASRSAVLEAISAIVTPRHTWDSRAYEAAIGSGAVARLDSEHLSRWSFIYSTMPALDRSDEREYRDAGDLYSLSRAGGALDEVERRDLLRAVENLTRDDAEMVGQAVQAENGMRLLGIHATAAGRKRVLDELRGRPGVRACLPDLEKRLG
jgi:hypothetical protein